ncbi:hypothetical protein EGW08_008950, partial [Elysia chlorotica]
LLSPMFGDEDLRIESVIDLVSILEPVHILWHPVPLCSVTPQVNCLTVLHKLFTLDPDPVCEFLCGDDLALVLAAVFQARLLKHQVPVAHIRRPQVVLHSQVLILHPNLGADAQKMLVADLLPGNL